MLNIRLIEEFASNLSFEAFAKNTMARYAVNRALEIISETSRGLSDEMKAEHPDVDWRGVAALGNVLRHAYRDVEDTIIWNIVRKDLAPLRAAVASEIEKLRPFSYGSLPVEIKGDILAPSDEKWDADT